MQSVGHVGGWCCVGRSVSVFVAGRPDTERRQELGQPWERGPCFGVHAKPPIPATVATPFMNPLHRFRGLRLETA